MITKKWTLLQKPEVARETGDLHPELNLRILGHSRKEAPVLCLNGGAPTRVSHCLL